MSILNKSLAALNADYKKRHQECAGRIAQAEEVLLCSTLPPLELDF